HPRPVACTCYFSLSTGGALGAGSAFNGLPGLGGVNGVTGPAVAPVALRISIAPWSQFTASRGPFVPTDPLALAPRSWLSTLISLKSLSISPSLVRASTLIAVLGGI